jgi:hypothetical protein
MFLRFHHELLHQQTNEPTVAPFAQVSAYYGLLFAPFVNLFSFIPQAFAWCFQFSELLSVLCVIKIAQSTPATAHFCSKVV